MVNCAMMHGLAISLPESVLVQSPLRLSACAHMHIHTRIGMRASSDARLAAARGLGRYRMWTRYQHVFGSYCRTSATRGVGSDSDFQVWGGSDDIAYLANSRMAVRWRLRTFAVPCPESPLQRSRRRSMPRVEIRCTRWMCPIGCVYARRVYARRVARARHSRVSIQNCPWKQSFEGSRTV